MDILHFELSLSFISLSVCKLHVLTESFNHLSFQYHTNGYTTRIIFQATPILPPDTLSLVCVWYALLTEDINLESNEDECVIDNDNGGCLVEDELGLSSSTEEDSEELHSG